MVRIVAVALALQIAVVVADCRVGLRSEKQVKPGNHDAVDIGNNGSYHGQVESFKDGVLQAEEGEVEEVWDDESLKRV